MFVCWDMGIRELETDSTVEKAKIPLDFSWLVGFGYRLLVTEHSPLTRSSWFTSSCCYRCHFKVEKNVNRAHIANCAALDKADTSWRRLNYLHSSSTYHVHKLSARHVTTTMSTSMTIPNREIIHVILLNVLLPSWCMSRPCHSISSSARSQSAGLTRLVSQKQT